MSFSASLNSDVQRQDKIIGLFVVIAVVLVLYLILLNTYFRSQKNDWIALHSQLGNSYGVTSGTLIELSGVTIGNVESLSLQPNAQVEMTLLIDNQYADLLRQDSRLKITSQLGLDTVLSGVRLALLPGASTELLENNDQIDIVVPKGFDQIIQNLKLDELTLQAQSIVTSLELLFAGLADSRGDMAALTHNANLFSVQLTEAGAQLPQILSDASSTLAAIQTSLETLDQSIAAVMNPAEQLILSTHQTMLSADKVLVDIQPALQQLPELLLTANQSVESLDKLSRQLSRHWLLGGDSAGDEDFVMPRLILPTDESLYSK